MKEVIDTTTMMEKKTTTTTTHNQFLDYDRMLERDRMVGDNRKEPDLLLATEDMDGDVTDNDEENDEKELVPSTSGSKSKSCPVPPLFSPNYMYDNSEVDAGACGELDLDVWNIESAAFRMITSQSFRIWRNTTFCHPFSSSSYTPNPEDSVSAEITGVHYTPNPEDSVSAEITGVPYKYWNWVVSVISVLDLIQQMQLVPERCLSLHEPLRDLLLPGRDESLLPDLDYAIGMEPDTPPTQTHVYSWWQKEFLPKTLDAFSCGFNEKTDTVVADPRTLPGDIQDYFATDRTIQQAWRLVKGYIRSPQKQRERGFRGQDYDLSLYVPFLDVPKAYMNEGIVPRPDGSIGGGMRTGFPTYQGPAIWFLFHTIAARFDEIDQICSRSNQFSSSANEKLAKTVKSLAGYFSLTGPCPYCRYHLMTRVSRNDMNWTSLQRDPKDYNNIGNKQYGEEYKKETGEFEIGSVSENMLYPLEYLFLGGSTGPTIKQKLDTVTDGKSLMLFYWKLHNAVTSSVENGYTCRSDEVSDVYPYYCNNNKYGTEPLAPKEFQIKNLEQENKAVNETTTTALLGRTWPTSFRWKFWLNTDARSFDMARNELETATTNLKELEGTYGTQIRQLYWSADSDEYLTGGDNVNVDTILRAVDELDKAILKTNLLSTEYALKEKPKCDLFEETIQLYEPLNAVEPLNEEGNFPWLPDVCYEDKKERKLNEANNNGWDYYANHEDY